MFDFEFRSDWKMPKFSCQKCGEKFYPTDLVWDKHQHKTVCLKCETKPFVSVAESNPAADIIF